MDTITSSIEPQELALPLQGQVCSLDCGGGERAELQVLQGCVWLTREGWPDDHFLRAGDSWSVAGRARLHMSAVGGGPARLALRRRRPD